MHDESDQNMPKRPLSEISHLFLSGIRDQAGEQRPRPVRMPPPSSASMRPAVPERPTMRVAPLEASSAQASPADASPVESSHREGSEAPMTIGATHRAESTSGDRRRRVTAVVGASVNSDAIADAALAYAASLAASGQRIGIIAVEGGTFRVQCVACDDELEETSDADRQAHLDVREAGDVLREMNHDVDRWLIILADPRRPDARAALRRADDWTMLATCDHDGIVGGYRTLKGLAEGEKAPLSIALVDAPDAMQARKVFEKLAGVCRQFLDWDVAHEPLEADVEHAEARIVYWCEPGVSRIGDAWAAIEQLLALVPDAAANAAHYGESDAAEAASSPGQPIAIPRLAQPIHVEVPTRRETPTARIEANVADAPHPEVAETKVSMTANPPQSFPSLAATEPMAPVSSPMMIGGSGDDVIDLPEGMSVLSAVLRAGTQLLATPIAPPMCADATITVGRDRGLVLVAQAQAGLVGIDAIASAVRWLDDSKSLVAMAMPQLAIDAGKPTKVLLLVDQADRAAIAVRPLFAGSDGRVTVRAYRKLRWGGRTGLLLDAA